MKVSLWGGRVVVHILGSPLNHRLNPDAPDPVALSELRKLCRDTEAPVRCIYSPQPLFTGRVVIPGAFFSADPIQISDDCSLLNGCAADGVLLPNGGDAYRVASADCHTLVLYDELSGMVAAIHTGRDNLLDKERIETGKTSRVYESIVQMAVGEFKKIAVDLNRFFNPARIHAYVCGGISAVCFAHPFTHPEKKRADYHKLMVADLVKRYGRTVFVGPLEQGCLDIPELIRLQLYELGVVQYERDQIDTYSDVDASGTYLWWSNRRNDQERNLVLVTRVR